jgi:hypothetical protein
MVLQRTGSMSPKCSAILKLIAILAAIRYVLLNVLLALNPTSVDDIEAAFAPLDLTHVTRSRPQKTNTGDVCASCQDLSDRYGIAHLATWGESDWTQRACWAQQKCTTVPEELKLLPPAVFEDVVDRDSRNYYQKLVAFIKGQAPLPERPHLLIAIPTVTRHSTPSSGRASGKLLRMVQQVLKQIKQLSAEKAAGVKVVVVNNSPGDSNPEFDTLREGMGIGAAGTNTTAAAPSSASSTAAPSYAVFALQSPSHATRREWGQSAGLWIGRGHSRSEKEQADWEETERVTAAALRAQFPECEGKINYYCKLNNWNCGEENDRKRAQTAVVGEGNNGCPYPSTGTGAGEGVVFPPPVSSVLQKLLEAQMSDYFSLIFTAHTTRFK